MSRRVKNSVYTICLLVLVYLVWEFRNTTTQDIQVQRFEFSGETMGTTYSVIYFADTYSDLKREVDSILLVVNQSLSTYIPESDISQFNKAEELILSTPLMLSVLKECEVINNLTDGAFDPTVMSLVNVWGFGPDMPVYPDSVEVDSILQFTGFDRIRYSSKKIWKSDPRVQLDFSAIAKGYGVDLVSEHMSSKGFQNHFVEIGGEVRCSGRNILTKRPWLTGITDPRSDQGVFSLIATLSAENQSVATSGNYYNYTITDGIRYSHTISPKTGYPIEQQILSASVIAPSCMTSDALATAFMVMGHEKAIRITEENEHIQSFIIYSGKNGELSFYISEGLSDRIHLTEDNL